MGKRKRKLGAAEKAGKARRKREFMTIFVNGKQERVRRPPTIEGMGVEEFVRRNADPIWLLQNEMYEDLHAIEAECAVRDERDRSKGAGDSGDSEDDSEVPF